MKNPLPRQVRSEPFCSKRDQPRRQDCCAGSAVDAMLRRRRLPVGGSRMPGFKQALQRRWLQELALALRMRHFCYPVPRPSVRHLLAHFCLARGVRPRPLGASS